jgi:signal transduction histidine kinase
MPLMRTLFYFYLLLAGAMSFAGGTAQVDRVTRLDSVALDGKAMALPPVSQPIEAEAGQPLVTRFNAWTLPAGTRQVQFNFKEPKAGSGQGYRFRYRLEGLDTEWREAGGNMRVSFRFFGNKETDFFSIGNWDVFGSSPGWTGCASNAPLVSQTRMIQVPPNVEGIDVSVVSGGNVDTVGILAVDNIRVFRVRDGVEDETPWVVAAFEPDPMGKPAPPWQNYMRADLCEMVAHPTERARHLLVLRDTSNTSYAEYNYRKNLDERIRAGDLLKIDWNWSYSIGSCERNPLTYNGMPPGKYRLHVQRVSTDALTVYEEVFLPFQIPELFYKTQWFVAVCSLLGAGLIFGFIAWNYRRRVQFRLSKLEWMRRLEEERTRIARDIHDDIGSRLTQIRLIAAAAQADSLAAIDQRNAMTRILDGALEAGHQLHEIIWAVKTENDTAEALAGYIAQTTQKLCSGCGMRFRLDIPTFLPPLTVASHLRYNLMLAIREAVTNALKHAQGSEISVRLVLDGNTMTIEVVDNGKGFVWDAVVPGEGLANMRARMKEIKGSVVWESKLDQGTKVTFCVTIPEELK